MIETYVRHNHVKFIYSGTYVKAVIHLINYLYSLTYIKKYSIYKLTTNSLYVTGKCVWIYIRFYFWGVEIFYIHTYVIFNELFAKTFSK